MSAYVLFFGGYQATQTQINIWCGSAKAQKPDVTFDGYAYPASASYRGASAVSAFKASGSLAEAIGTVQECATDKIYIVGHSSGCAIANAVDAGLKDTSNVTLVALDGFAPSRAQLARPSTQVWVAECGKSLSLNHDLIDTVGKRVQIHRPADCFSKWALHFSVVNSAASDKVVTDISTGYAQCRANLMWM